MTANRKDVTVNDVPGRTKIMACQSVDFAIDVRVTKRMGAWVFEKQEAIAYRDGAWTAW